MKLLDTSALISTFLIAGGAWAAELPQLDRVMPVKPPRELPDVELLDHRGETFRFSDLEGSPTIVAFGFTNCPDVCPTTMERLRSLKETHAEALDGVQVALVSVDGERDRPTDLATFLARFSGEFVGVTGDPDTLREVAQAFRAVFFKETPDPRTGNYNVAHSIQLFALDKQADVRAELYNAPPESIVALMHMLASE